MRWLVVFAFGFSLFSLGFSMGAASRSGMLNECIAGLDSAAKTIRSANCYVSPNQIISGPIELGPPPNSGKVYLRNSWEKPKKPCEPQ